MQICTNYIQIVAYHNLKACTFWYYDTYTWYSDLCITITFSPVIPVSTEQCLFSSHLSCFSTTRSSTSTTASYSSSGTEISCRKIQNLPLHYVEHIPSKYKTLTKLHVGLILEQCRRRWMITFSLHVGLQHIKTGFSGERVKSASCLLANWWFLMSLHGINVKQEVWTIVSGAHSQNSSYSSSSYIVGCS